MASFVLFNGSEAARALNDGESGFIAQSGSLAITGDAIVAAGSVDATVLGSLYSELGNAIDHDGASIELYVGLAGAIGAADVDTVAVAFTDNAFVSNAGYLSSGSDSLDIRVSDAGGAIAIHNTGVIAAASDGIVTSSGDEATRIVNHGRITGDDGGIDHLAGAAFLLNFGDIAGTSYGYDGSANVDRVRNFGTIEGGVVTEAGDDRVVNRGYIDSVDLGDGADTYGGARGVVDTTVLGGAGDDTLRGGDDRDSFRGGAGDDALLGAEGDDDLEGGGGADVLRGGRGDDVLAGGAGPDRFVFASGDGFDRIVDYSGNDVIDLRDLGLRSFASGVRDQIVDARGGALLDFGEDHGFRVLLAGVEATDVGSADFLI